MTIMVRLIIAHVLTTIDHFPCSGPYSKDSTCIIPSAFLSHNTISSTRIFIFKKKNLRCKEIVIHQEPVGEILVNSNQYKRQC